MPYEETSKPPKEEHYKRSNRKKDKKPKIPNNKNIKEALKEENKRSNQKPKNDYRIYGVKKTTDFIKPDRDLPRPLETMIERGGGCLGIFSPPGSGKCLEKNQLVEHKEKGNIKIKDIKIGDFINSKNGFVEVINIYHNGVKETFKTTLKNKMEIISTLDHKIETLKGMKPIKEIKDDLIVTKNGNSKILKTEYFRKVETIDLEVNHKEHTFYCNGVSTSNSNFLTNLILREEFFKDLFDGGLYFISPTIHSDLTAENMIEYCDFTHDEMTEELLEGIYKNIMSVPKEDRNLSCIVFDDCLGSRAMRQHTILNKMISSCRHMKTLFIFSLQAVKGLTPNLRSCLSHTITFYQPSNKQFNDLVELHSFFGGEEEFIKNYKQSCNPKYGFMLNDWRDLKSYAWGSDLSEPKLMWSRYDDNGEVMNNELNEVNKGKLSTDN